MGESIVLSDERQRGRVRDEAAKASEVGNVLRVGALVVGVLIIGPAVIVSSSAGATTKCKGINSPNLLCSIAGTATVTAGSLAVVAPPTIKWSDTLSGYANTVVQRQGDIHRHRRHGFGWGLDPHGLGDPLHRCDQLHCQQTRCRGLRTKQISVDDSSTSLQTDDAPKESCATGSTCTLPSAPKIAYPVSLTLTAKTGQANPTALVTNAMTSGMGAITVATDWWLPIPASTYAGTYTDTITLTISSGP